jgi:hypothetical protein
MRLEVNLIKRPACAQTNKQSYTCDNMTLWNSAWVYVKGLVVSRVLKIIVAFGIKSRLDESPKLYKCRAPYHRNHHACFPNLRPYSNVTTEIKLAKAKFHRKSQSERCLGVSTEPIFVKKETSLPWSVLENGTYP